MNTAAVNKMKTKKEKKKKDIQFGDKYPIIPHNTHQ